MRGVLLLLATVSLMGCGSTRIIEATWDEGIVEDLVGKERQVTKVRVNDTSVGAQRATFASDSLTLETTIPLGQAVPSSLQDLVIPGGSPLFHRLVVPSGGIQEMKLTHRSSRRGRLLALGVSFLPGVLFGSVGGLLVGGCSLVGYDPCSKGRRTIFSVAGAATVMGIGALIGGVIGAKETTVYRSKHGQVSARLTGASVQLDLGR